MAGDRYILLVEGKDEIHVISHLCQQHQIPETFKIEDGGGISHILESLPIRLTVGSSVDRLGIVVDADLSVADRWQALRNILLKAGYEASKIPQAPDPEGTVIEQGDRRISTIGIWLMPDNKLPGMLETFVTFLVPPADSLWQAAVECVEQLSEQRFPATHLDKAHLHTWLAWQEEPGSPMGQAITRRYLDAHTPHAQQLIAWLRRLFESSPPTPS